MHILKRIFLMSLIAFTLGCAPESSILSYIELEHQETDTQYADEQNDAEHENYDDRIEQDLTDDIIEEFAACKKASSAQIAAVNTGAALYSRFISKCTDETGSKAWCQQIARPNPSSKSTFYCTYGTNQPHLLINPDETTWTNAFQAIKLVLELQTQSVKVAQIYNWWRPEPYNANVGGAAGRHPYGTSVDVRFASMTDMKRAHSLLCKIRNQGRMRALGFYGSTGLHLGINDRMGNTWGKACPN